MIAPHTLPVPVDPFVVSLLLDWKLQAMAFVWGLLWGSFANVVIHRVPRGLSVVSPRSRCGACETPIAWYDNIPVVSYLLLRGQCRSCKAHFGMRYMIVELLAGVLSFALWMQWVVAPLVAGAGLGGSIAWALWFVFCLGMMICIYVDLDEWIILDEITLPLALIGFVVAAIDDSIVGVPLTRALGAGAFGYGLVWIIRAYYLRFRNIEGIGLGDAKLLLAIGAFCGPGGVYWALSGGALQGLIVAVPMLLLGKEVANVDLQEVHGDDPELGEEDPDAGIAGRRVPFGPFLALAAMEFVLLRPQLEVLWAWMTGAL